MVSIIKQSPAPRSLKTNIAHATYYVKRFFWLIPLTNIGENPDQYNLGPYMHFILILSLFVILFFLILFIFRHKVKAKLLQIFDYIITYKIVKKLIVNWCILLLYLRGYFELETKVLILLFSTPNILYILNLLFKFFPSLETPLILTSFWFTTALCCYSIDDLCIFLSKILLKEITFNLIFTEELEKTIKLKDNPIIQSGIFTLGGKLTAAGQAAIYTGMTAALTGISITAINAWAGLKRDQATAQENESQRQADAKKRQEDYRENRRQRQATARENERQRQARARENERQRQATARENEEQRQATARENEKQRQHERDRWEENKKGKWF
jgi:hypothetical protein